MAGTHHHVPLEPRAIAVFLLVAFTTTLISCSTATGPVDVPGRAASLYDARGTPPSLSTATAIGLRVTDDIPWGSGERRNGGSVALGGLAGAGTGLSGCARLGQGGPVGVMLFVVCAPFGVVGGALVGAASVPHDSPSSSTSKLTRSSGIAKPTRAGMLAVAELYAAFNGVPTVREASGGASKNQKPRPQAPVKLLDITMFSVFYGYDYVRIETKIQVISLVDRSVLDSWAFTARADQTDTDDALIERAMLEAASAALDESVLVYRGEDKLPAVAGPVDANASKAGVVASVFPDYTLRPLQPGFTTNSYAGRLQEGGTRLEVDSLQPSFQWEKWPARFEKDPAFTSGVKNLTYEFKLYRKRFKGWAIGPQELPAYARSGIVLPSLVLEYPLEPCAHYFWTVRAHFELEGQPRVTEWTGAYDLPEVGVTPTAYRRNRAAVVPTLPTIAVLYPEFRTIGACPGA